ncbi:BamA/TamA family outer membrane protein [Flavobacterium agricola]|uniref:BamA/TamA family outer membrane protein n=1 Tax=Flavobacterium agricola TaxID=2870839 RepID=A0ABY6M3C9_9FLAO|nr:BamA/TamA family outer membrane protein [Flavobacterium agricola]UYW01493.1 BamA/TamA family outer membrane protein [Flavobacterium agricola]
MKSTVFSIKYFLLLVLIAIYTTSCSGIKAVPEGEYLYVGPKIAVLPDSIYSKSERKAFDAEINALLFPKPNKSFWGMRPGLFFHNLKNPEKKSGLGHWLSKKFGEEPILLSNVDVNYNRDLIVNRLENKGYFNVRAEAEANTKVKTATVDYEVTPNAQFLIRDVSYASDSSRIWQDILKTEKHSLLKPNQPYNLDVIKQERVRIDTYLRNHGYFYFIDDYLLIQADSSVGKHQVDLRLVLKPTTPKIAKYPYSINDIFVYVGNNDANYFLNYKKDTVPNYKNIVITDLDSLFKPKIFDNTIHFKTGGLYNRRDQSISLNRLVNLGIFKFVKNQFVIADSLNHKLNVMYMLSPSEMKSLRFETTGKTNSASYTGFEVSTNWQHKNLFKGGERFKFSVFGGMDFQLGGNNQGYDIYRLGSELSINWPRLIAPFGINYTGDYVPRTQATIGYEFQKRMQLYALNTFKTSFGYNWKYRTFSEHNLDVIEIFYVSPTSVTELFQNQAQTNSYDARILNKQLTFGPTYSYTFTNTMLNKKNTWYYKGSADLSANIVGLLTGANVKKGKEKEILGVPFSQYAKVENDIRFYHKVSPRATLATRFLAGVAYPYGNSKEVPYLKQFFIGGSNSIRAFRPRSIGPGSYDPKTAPSSFLMDQSGDIKLEANIEYRPKLFSVFEGAIFVDAGNVWLINKNEARPGGEFTKDFYKDIAIGAGVGLRVDIELLIFRLDLAFPVRYPYGEDRWAKIDLLNSRWRKDNLLLNFAIGYPF